MGLKPGYQSLPCINVSIFNKDNQCSESVFSPTFPPNFVSYKGKVRGQGKLACKNVLISPLCYPIFYARPIDSANNLSYSRLVDFMTLPESVFDLIQLWKVSSRPESVILLAQQAENSTSGWGSSCERCRLGSWFSTSVFRNVSGVVPDNIRISGFRRSSSNMESAPKMRDSVLLNSWDSFLVTLLSISSETWAI